MKEPAFAAEIPRSPATSPWGAQRWRTPVTVCTNMPSRLRFHTLPQRHHGEHQGGRTSSIVSIQKHAGLRLHILLQRCGAPGNNPSRQKLRRNTVILPQRAFCFLAQILRRNSNCLGGLGPRRLQKGRARGARARSEFQKLSFVFGPLGLTFCALSPRL